MNNFEELSETEWDFMLYDCKYIEKLLRDDLNRCLIEECSAGPIDTTKPMPEWWREMAIRSMEKALKNGA